MFQFPWLSSLAYFIQQVILEVFSSGFPHSEISGSQPICDSPKHFGACPVLLRLLVPRHPPYALIILTYCLLVSFFCLLFDIYVVFKVLCRFLGLVDLDGLEPSTSRLSGVRSNHLSYKSIYKQNSVNFDFKLLRKEVIQPHLPIRLPCYDFTPVIAPTFDSCLLLWLAHWLRVLTTPMV